MMTKTLVRLIPRRLPPIKDAAEVVTVIAETRVAGAAGARNRATEVRAIATSAAATDVGDARGAANARLIVAIRADHASGHRSKKSFGADKKSLSKSSKKGSATRARRSAPISASQAVIWY